MSGRRKLLVLRKNQVQPKVETAKQEPVKKPTLQVETAKPKPVPVKKSAPKKKKNTKEIIDDDVHSDDV
jgi:hypothetical protein